MARGLWELGIGSWDFLLEVELYRETDEAWAEQGSRLPELLDNRRRRVVGLVEVVFVRPHGVVVEQVVDIDADVEALVGEPKVLRELHVEYAVALAVQLTRVEEIHRIGRRGRVVTRVHKTTHLARRGAARARLRRAEGTARLPRHLLLGKGVVRFALDAGPPLEHRAQEHVDPGNRV